MPNFLTVAVMSGPGESAVILTALFLKNQPYEDVLDPPLANASFFKSLLLCFMTHLKT